MPHLSPCRSQTGQRSGGVWERWLAFTIKDEHVSISASAVDRKPWRLTLAPSECYPTKAKQKKVGETKLSNHRRRRWSELLYSYCTVVLHCTALHCNFDCGVLFSFFLGNYGSIAKWQVEFRLYNSYFYLGVANVIGKAYSSQT